jgi:hypothetical protein
MRHRPLPKCAHAHFLLAQCDSQSANVGFFTSRSAPRQYDEMWKEYPCTVLGTSGGGGGRDRPCVCRPHAQHAVSGEWNSIPASQRNSGLKSPSAHAKA